MGAIDTLLGTTIPIVVGAGAVVKVTETMFPRVGVQRLRARPKRQTGAKKRRASRKRSIDIMTIGL